MRTYWLNMACKSGVKVRTTRGTVLCRLLEDTEEGLVPRNVCSFSQCSSEQGSQVFTNPLLRTITPGSLRVVSRDIALGLREPSASLLVRRSSNDVFGRVRLSIFWTVLLFLSLLRFLFILFAHSLSLKKYSVSRTQSEAFPSVFKILAHSLCAIFAANR